MRIKVIQGLGLVVLFLTCRMTGLATADGQGRCFTLATTNCGVGAGAGHFHGVVAVRGAPWVLSDAAHSGTKPGCGDCIWSLVIACPVTSPAGVQSCSAATRSLACRPHEVLYRVYLTTHAITDQLRGTVCIGGDDRPVPVGDRAAADVQRYLRNVAPPDLRIATRPRLATLAGLATYFEARPPTSLAPAGFGGPEIRETITITPVRTAWQWGDGDDSGWSPAGSRMAHTYRRGGIAHGSVTTRWGATYTVTYDGQTIGPYDADGRLTKRQPFQLAVRTSSPTLVSH